jgi:hypothetical protein
LRCRGRLAWRLHLGRSRSPFGRALAQDRRHLRHVGGGDECGGAGPRPSAGRGAGAREALEAFWRRVSDAARFSPFQRGPLDVILGRWTLDSSPIYVAMDLMSRLVSPYDFNPMGKNPLREILAELIDFKVLAQSPIHLFITATNVRTGRGKVFKNDAVTPDVLLASACLPTMFQAVEIDGEAYWDGGYSGNPTLTTLVRECKSHDTILVPINPIERPGVPRSASEILNRLNEVSFNAVVLKELRMMALLRKVADPGEGEGALWAQMRMHPSEHGHDRTWARRRSSTRNGRSSRFCATREKIGAGVPGRPRDGPRQALDARHRRPARGNLSAWDFSASWSRSGS